MATRKIKRTSCGFCMTNNDSRHRNCPGSIPRAAGGVDWVCWCSENGHPASLPEAPVTMVVVDEPKDDGPTTSPDEPSGTPEGKRKGRTPKEPTPRCGAPTGRGPCKRRAGHTAGHDGR